VSTAGEVIVERLRHFSIDIVPLSEEDFNEFKSAVANYGSETIPIKVQDRFYALVIYPEWSRQGLLNVYKLFNTTPLELPAGLDLGVCQGKVGRA
jgi:hypothetical protein